MALTKFNFNSFDLTTAASKGLAFNSSANGFETSSAGSMTLIKTLTASSSANLSFVHGSSDVVLDSTYPVYLFKWINCHPATNDTDFTVNFRDGGSNYTTATLSDSGYVTGSSGQRILTGQATISGQPSGQSMRWKLALANKQVKIHGVSLSWA